MGAKEDDITSARAAFAVFYERHYSYIGNICSRFKNLCDVEELVNDVFLRVYERANQYNGKAPKDEDYRRRSVLAWMGRIVRNLAVDSGSSISVEAEELGEDEIRVASRSNSTSLESAENMTLISDALAELTERERDIILVTYDYVRSNHAHNRLPNAVAKDLASKWNTTTTNIRQIRHRARKKIEKMLAQKKMKV